MPFIKGSHHSIATCNKMSETHTGSHHSQEHCKRISESLKGIVFTEEQRKKMSDSAKRRIRHPHSDETKKKISLAHIGKKHSPEHCRKNGDAHKGMKFSVESRKKISEAGVGKQLGCKHWNWKGGISPLTRILRNCLKMERWRDEILKRDNYTCWYTGLNKNICVHHIIPFSHIIKKNNIITYEQAIECEELWDINNGVTMTKKAHKWYHEVFGNMNN